MTPTEAKNLYRTAVYAKGGGTDRWWNDSQAELGKIVAAGSDGEAGQVLVRWGYREERAATAMAKKIREEWERMKASDTEKRT